MFHPESDSPESLAPAPGAHGGDGTAAPHPLAKNRLLSALAPDGFS